MLAQPLQVSRHVNAPDLIDRAARARRILNQANRLCMRHAFERSLATVRTTAICKAHFTIAGRAGVEEYAGDGFIVHDRVAHHPQLLRQFVELQALRPRLLEHPVQRNIRQVTAIALASAHAVVAAANVRVCADKRALDAVAGKAGVAHTGFNGFERKLAAVLIACHGVRHKAHGFGHTQVEVANGETLHGIKQTHESDVDAHAAAVNAAQTTKVASVFSADDLVGEVARRGGPAAEPGDVDVVFERVLAANGRTSEVAVAVVAVSVDNVFLNP
jgi:hypothetical protein